MLPRRFFLRHGERVYEVILEEGREGVLFRVGQGGEERLQVRERGPWLEVHGPLGRHRLRAVAVGQGVWVWHGGRAFLLTREREAPPAGPEGPALRPVELTSPMTGRVTAVRVSPGQEVEEGEILVTITAMKMEYHIQAPYRGRVTHVLCREGEQVDLGQPLVRVEPVEGEGQPTGPTASA